MACFRDIYCDICLKHVKIVTACSDKSSKFNSFACTVFDFHVFGGLNFSLMNEANTFRIFNSIREIRENKNLVKISTYRPTVLITHNTSRQ